MNDFINAKALGPALRLTLMICGCFSVIVVLVYVLARGWNDATAWAAFGDYLSGLLNPIFAFANVIVLVIISYQLAVIENSRAEKGVATQREIALYSIQHGSFEKINLLLDRVHAAVIEDPKTASSKLRLIKIDLSTFLHANLYLFPVLGTFDIVGLNDVITRLENSAEPFAKSDQERASKSAAERKQIWTELIESSTEFATQRGALSRLLADYLIEHHHRE
ncbi:hypothetical protein [Dyadobacter sp. MSC1_007]|jgi:uncharacterized membrane protein|uniref:hypothetical protein n=1 Tax=Dyadobacter sp. MSC1_007 TaxID=2909264 RepID=UPI002030B54B|nr:hypothetical protein [Dyadobacter sp. MSC1_007]